MDIQVGDILVMKKAHPCGSREWEVLRTGGGLQAALPRLRSRGHGRKVKV